MSKTVAVIAAHPDDEILGCGGAVAKHVDSGDSVHAFILSEGVTGRDSIRSSDLRSSELQQLKKFAQQANEALGVSSLDFGSFYDQRMDSYDCVDVTKSIEQFIQKTKPSIIYTHFAGDLNRDHRIVSESVITAARSFPGSTVSRILFFETVSSTEWRLPSFMMPFDPNWFVDISSMIDKKIRALQSYNLEMREYPHPRSFKSIEYLARWRGSIVGVNAAEAFVLGRSIE